MPERYFTKNYTISVNAAMKDDLKDPEIYKFPYSPFVANAVSLTLNQLLELANKFDENWDNNKRYEDLLRRETQLFSRIGKEQ